MAGELETVDVEGWQAFILRETIEPMLNSELPGSVHLLPLFDAYVVGIGRGEEIETLLPGPHQRLVYRPQGWISAVVLVDGCIQGIWEYQAQRTPTRLKVRMFSPPAASIRKAIEAEGERLGAFLNQEIAIDYEDL